MSRSRRPRMIHANHGLWHPRRREPLSLLYCTGQPLVLPPLPRATLPSRNTSLRPASIEFASRNGVRRNNNTHRISERTDTHMARLHWEVLALYVLACLTVPELLINAPPTLQTESHTRTHAMANPLWEAGRDASLTSGYMELRKSTKSNKTRAH